MNFKWLAVIGLVAVPMLAQAEGWLLMVPPFEAAGSAIIVKSDAPMKEWQQWSAFDDAGRCESELATIRRRVTVEGSPW